MNIGISDLVHVWDWVQRRRLKTITEFSGRQPNCAASLPCPLLESLSYYPFGQLGEPVPIVISAINLGDDGASGGLTVSFPEVAHNGERCYVEAHQPEKGNLISREAGDELLSSDRGSREEFTAKYLLREVQVTPWRKGERIVLRLKVTPVREGAIVFYVTAWSATRTWQIVRTPATREVVDQQNHSVLPFVLNVAAKK